MPRSHVWLGGTDADSAVPRDWLAAMVDQAQRGAHLVLGTVLPGLDAVANRRTLQRHTFRFNV